MLLIFLSLVLLLATLSVSLNIPRVVESAQIVPEGIVQLNIDTIPTVKAAFNKVYKRQSASPIITNLKGLDYLINYQIGTPPQNLTAIIDTGSSDTFVNPTCTNAQRPTICSSFPHYTPALSSTSKDLNRTLSQSYGSGSVTGVFWHDTITLGRAQILASQFGVARSSRGFDNGLMGVGFGNLPVYNTTTYPNIVDELALQGVTASRAFSLDLGSISATAGSIIFGGIDTKKYSGKLQKVPILPIAETPDKFPRYWVNMSSVGYSLPSNATTANTSTLHSTTITNATTPVFLDSGTTLSLLPPSIVKGIITAFKNVQSLGGGEYTLPCSNRDVAGTINFGFGGEGGVVIRVPFSEFLWIYGTDEQTGEELCALGSFENDLYVLGDTVLRSTFVVYDQDNANLHIAQAAACGSNLVPIGKGVDAVPSLAGDCPAV